MNNLPILESEIDLAESLHVTQFIPTSFTGQGDDWDAQMLPQDLICNIFIFKDSTKWKNVMILIILLILVIMIHFQHSQIAVKKN